MKHAMREYPIYAVTTVVGAPVFPGDEITDFRGEAATFVEITRGPEYGTATVRYRRPMRHSATGETYEGEVPARVFALLVDLHCPGCGLPVAVEPCDCCVPGNCSGACHDCGWVHPALWES